jgi:hypothetical protein
VVASPAMIRFRDSRRPRRRGWALAVVAALLLLTSDLARGDASSRATLAIHLVPDGIPAWHADAVSRALALDLGEGRLHVPSPAGAPGPIDTGPPGPIATGPVPDAAPGQAPGAMPGAPADARPPALAAAARCPIADDACARAAYRAAGVDVALRGQLSGDRLAYRIVLTWPDASPPVRAGTVDLRGRDRARLADALRAALHPIVRPGGALDERDRAGRAARPAALAVPAASGVALAALAAGLLLLVPLGLGALALGWSGARQLVRTRALRGTGLALAALIAIVAGADAAGGGLGAWSWALFLAGGMAWGTFAAVTLPVVFPPLRGLERVEPGELFAVLRAWFALVLRRAAQVALFYAPFALALWAACEALAIPAPVALGVVAPLWALLARLWLRSLVEVLALCLDRDRIDGDAAVAQAWNEAVRAYFLGYLRRAGEADPRVLGDVRFYPGRGSEVALYGGGLTHTRLVIGRDLLEIALSPPGRPHDYALPRVSKLHWTEWNAGLVVPTRRDLPMATPEERLPTQTTVEGEIEHVPLGEPRTLAGIVEPSALDQRVSHRPWEDPAWLAWEPGDEHDGTDAGDKDFLFGLLAHELGRALRHEDRTATLGLAWRRWPGRLPLLRRLPRARPTELADLHATLNLARHHQVQYLAFCRYGRDDLLTARAHEPELERRTREIAAELDGAAAGPDPTLHRRLVRMAGASLGQPSRAPGWRRRVALAGFALAVAAIATAAAARAIDYHPIYLERTGERPRDNGQEQ